MPTVQNIRKVALVILAGPIKHWWDENWDTPEHWHYDAWREALSASLVADGHYLVYRPHHAYKGTWTERGQAVNDAALKAADAVIDMTPPGVPSEGTVSEIRQASSSGAVIVKAPPAATREEFDAAIRLLIERLEALGIHRDMVDQDEVLECISWQSGREWLLRAMFLHFNHHVYRFHFTDADGRLSVADGLSPWVRNGNVYWIPLHKEPNVQWEDDWGSAPLADGLKVEVLPTQIAITQRSAS